MPRRLLILHVPSEDDSVEFRYSLRSLYKNFHPIDPITHAPEAIDVTLVTPEPPRWLTEPTHTHTHTQAHTHTLTVVHHDPAELGLDHLEKGYRMANALSAGLTHLSEDTTDTDTDTVTFLADDYFLLYPSHTTANVNAGPAAAQYGTARRTRSMGPEHWWTMTMGNTIKLVEEEIMGLPRAHDPRDLARNRAPNTVPNRYRAAKGNPNSVISYEMHAPFTLDIGTALAACDLVRNNPNPTFWRTVYGNLAATTDPSSPTSVSFPAKDGRWDNMANAAGVPWVTSDPQIWAKRGQKIAAMFPEPSPWEAKR